MKIYKLFIILIVLSNLDLYGQLIENCRSNYDVAYGDDHIHLVYGDSYSDGISLLKYVMLDTSLNIVSNMIDIPNTESYRRDFDINYQNRNLSLIWESIDDPTSPTSSNVQHIFYNINNGEFTDTFVYDDKFLFNFSPVFSFINDTNGVAIWLSHSNGDNFLSGQSLTLSKGAIGQSQELLDSIDVNCKRVKNIVLADSIVFVVWIDNRTGSDQVYGRLFKSDLVAIGASFQISEAENGTIMFGLDIAKTTNDNLLVAWSKSIEKNWNVEGVWLNEFGNKLSDIICISRDSVLYGAEVKVAINYDNETVVIWEEALGNNAKIFGQRFSANREKIGEPFPISTSHPNDNQYWPNVLLVDKKFYSFWAQPDGIYANCQDFNSISSLNEEPSNPETFVLQENYPNPFNPHTTIPFTLSGQSKVNLSIYDLNGNIVKKLANEKLQKGYYQYQWDATDISGNKVSSGIYFYKLSTDNWSQTKKMVLLQ